MGKMIHDGQTNLMITILKTNTLVLTRIASPERSLLEKPLGMERRFLSKNSDTGLRDERRSSRNFCRYPRPKLAAVEAAAEVSSEEGNPPAKGLVGTAV